MKHRTPEAGAFGQTVFFNTRELWCKLSRLRINFGMDKVCEMCMVKECKTASDTCNNNKIAIE